MSGSGIRIPSSAVCESLCRDPNHVGDSDVEKCRENEVGRRLEEPAILKHDRVDPLLPPLST